MVCKSRSHGSEGRGSPAELMELTRAQIMVIVHVRVMFTDRLSFDQHVNRICSAGRQSQYPLQILTAHGLSGTKLNDVIRMTTIARMQYAAPAWWGFVGQQERNRMQSVMNRLIPKMARRSNSCVRQSRKAYSSRFYRTLGVYTAPFPSSKKIPDLGLLYAAEVA